MAAVANAYRSWGRGGRESLSRIATSGTRRSPFFASSSSVRDRPWSIDTGAIVRGKTTVSRSGNTGSASGVANAQLGSDTGSWFASRGCVMERTRDEQWQAARRFSAAFADPPRPVARSPPSVAVARPARPGHRREASAGGGSASAARQRLPRPRASTGRPSPAAIAQYVLTAGGAVADRRACRDVPVATLDPGATSPKRSDPSRAHFFV